MLALDIVPSYLFGKLRHVLMATQLWKYVQKVHNVVLPFKLILYWINDKIELSINFLYDMFARKPNGEINPHAEEFEDVNETSSEYLEDRLDDHPNYCLITYEEFKKRLLEKERAEKERKEREKALEKRHLEEIETSMRHLKEFNIDFDYRSLYENFVSVIGMICFTCCCFVVVRILVQNAFEGDQGYYFALLLSYVAYEMFEIFRSYIVSRKISPVK